jgi:hypothetical protein
MSTRCKHGHDLQAVRCLLCRQDREGPALTLRRLHRLARVAAQRGVAYCWECAAEGVIGECILGEIRCEAHRQAAERLLEKFLDEVKG